ncbi:MAG: DUF1156 domain-containing protein [Actinomycetia bacterium]|nr:DUF1156 domain-containing protein [Actinomycetes bacterium]
MGPRRKLIEVALPLAAINRESAREKSIRHGHPSTLHLWWARRPLAACRAVLFASLVDDPGNTLPEPAATRERQRLFGLIEQLVNWDHVQDERLLAAARAEILKSTGGAPPAVFDPFCGGGSLPLEAQRLGLTGYAADLNPVAVLITKALIEIPPRFAGRAPVHPAAQRTTVRGGWRGAAGLAADIRAYGAWMREEAARRIGHLYPPGPQGETVIAWLWARTVRCPNPACGIAMPLVRTFQLSTRKGHEAWVEPVVDRAARRVRFRVHMRVPPDLPHIRRGTKVAARGAKFQCVACGTLVDDAYVQAEGRAGRLGNQMLATVMEGPRGRLYGDPVDSPAIAVQDVSWLEAELADDPRNVWCKLYGLKTFADLFTPRQLVALTTFSDLVGVVRERIRAAAVAAGWPDDGVPLAQGGRGAAAYADAVATYLAFAVDKLADYSSSLTSWIASRDTIRGTFSRQALPMVWDFAEANPFSSSTGNWGDACDWVATAVERLPDGAEPGQVVLADATADAASVPPSVVIATDPPYYDNVGYADLADFFYVWLRRALRPVWPELFRTVLTPKASELIVNPYRFEGNREAAEAHFQSGMQRAFRLMRARSDPAFPATVFYAFKQTDSETDPNTGDEDPEPAAPAEASRGWEAMLTALVDAGFAIDGTWPLRTERTGRTNQLGANALASSIVLVCRPRPADAPVASRQEFVAALRRELPAALDTLTQAGIAAVDLQQAAIGPGMAVYSRYGAVLDTHGRPLPVREALALINRELDAYLAQEEGEIDPVTRFAAAWFSEHGFAAAPYGEADVVLRARNTSEQDLRAAQIAQVGHGQVQLLRLHEDPEAALAWPGPRDRVTVWAATLRLAAALQAAGGSADAGRVAARVGPGVAEAARQLAYRLFAVCDRRGWGADAQRFNELVAAWPLIREEAARTPGVQGRLDL